MDNATHKTVVRAILAAASWAAKEGLDIIPAPPFFGFVLLGLAAALAWSALAHSGWLSFLTRRYIHYTAYGIIIVVFLPLALFVHPHITDAPTDTNEPGVSPPSVVATAPTGSTVTAIGTFNGNLTVKQSGPNQFDTINKKLDALLSLTDSEMNQLEKEYDLGFVLIALSGEVNATRVMPHTNRVESDWGQCIAFKDEKGRLHIGLPQVVEIQRPGGHMISLFATGADYFIGAIPSSKSSLLSVNVSDVQLRLECLKTQPIGICAVIGFKDTRTRPQ